MDRSYEAYLRKKERDAQRMKARRAERAELGLCLCGAEREPGKSRCRPCLDAANAHERRKKAAEPKVGRPRLEVARDAKPIYLRLSASERKVCEQAARLEGKPLARWARDALLLRAAAHGE